MTKKEKRGLKYFRFAQRLYVAGVIGRSGLDVLYSVAFNQGKITHWDIDCVRIEK